MFSKLVRLVMDVKTFENYPWGRVAFKKLIASVKKLDLSKTSYLIHGFVEVLQIWVYTAMPEYGASHGKPLHGNTTPPLLAYKGAKGQKNMRKCLLEQVRLSKNIIS